MRTLLFALTLSAGIAACTSTSSDTTVEQSLTNAGCTVNAPDPRACDPADTSKTTVCHIPPGNPANAHTICVGNAAVPAHIDHGDVLGTCTCPGDGDVDAGVDVDADTGGGGVGLQ